jgi:hypothetical protein
MKKVIVLAGVSGTGKTHARTHDPELKDLPYVDIAEIYERWPELGWYEALYALLKRARLLLQKHDTIVIEQWERGEITAPEYRRRIELLKRCWRPQPSARR